MEIFFNCINCNNKQAKEAYASIYTFNAIVKHLLDALEIDPRKKERARCKVALTNIEQWYKMGEDEYDK